MDNNITKSDLTELCRVCMNRNLNMKQLFDVKNKNIIGKIEFCTGVMFKPEIGHPTQICKVCLRNLSIAHKFKTICLQSDETLQKHLSTIKIEVIKSDYNEPNHNTEEDYVDFHDNNEDINNTDITETVESSEHKSPVNDNKGATICDKKCEERLTVDKNEKQKKAPVRLKKYKFRKLFCETCNIKFENKAESDAHRRKVHKEKVGWVCEICGKNFIHRASLHTHVRSHMPPQHACDRCDYRTTNKYDLVKHLRTHTGEKRYKCGQCGSSYHTVSNLLQHTRRQHERERRFPCPRAACTRAFADRTKLNRHIDSHDEVKRHVCTVCHSAFTRRCYWKKHLQRQHNIEIPPIRPGRQKENFLIEDFTTFNKFIQTS